jgi:phosphoribosyl 1,2-cyclic phosphodiesterase
MHDPVLQQQIDSLLGAFSGLLTVLASVVATHPHYDHLQLHLASMQELSNLRSGLSDQQLNIANKIVEQMQHLQAMPPGSIRPLKDLHL